ncbi:TRAP-type mannitol/chloroaromatic compound transport system, small permease component [Congregibacter litoralis KT71]|uniref:TRAP transporter small permease protein n=1 Tax=Congregibacter litoralis KT71 TaxID=314285 RepID=A4A992_9GAMM|nr:TRAP-type mannitol/chloroaromatic compound transport system, small permease component [Congregibacter litoralis KT71]
MIPSPSGIKKGSKKVLNWTSFIQAVDRFTLFFGRLLAWCALAMALLTAAVVTLRYGFATGAIAMQEAVTYLHGSLFMLGVAYALKTGAHVRVDIFYRSFSARHRAWVDALGGIVFLLPLCAVIVFVSWGYVADSWAIRESSPEPGGIPYLYLLKTLLPLMAINLAIAGIADISRNAQLLIWGENS